MNFFIINWYEAIVRMFSRRLNVQSSNKRPGFINVISIPDVIWKIYHFLLIILSSAGAIVSSAHRIISFCSAIDQA